MSQVVTWDENMAAEVRFTAGLNLTVLGLIGATPLSEPILGVDSLIAPARSSEKDLKVEKVGRDATGFVITVLSASLVSIRTCTGNKYQIHSMHG